MARQTLAKTTAPGPNPTAGVAVTMTAEDASNHSQFAWTGSEVLIIQNSHASTPYTYTLTSVADPFGRTGDITTQAIAAGAIHVIDSLSSLGWKQTNGMVYLEANNAAVKFGVITIAGRTT